MKKLIHNILVVLFLSCGYQQLLAQNLLEENSLVRLRLNSMFAHFNKGGAPTGLLRDFAIEYIELGL